MRFVLVIFFFTQFAFASAGALRLTVASMQYDEMIAKADALALKNASFEYCVEKGEKIKKYKKQTLFNFMEECIMRAGANLTAQQNPKVCFEAAKLGNNESDIRLLNRKCRDEVGYQLCRADAKDFTSRVNCIASTKSPIPYAECPAEVKALTELRKKEKSLVLTAKQSEIFKKGFCDRPTMATPPSPDEGAEPTQR